MSRKEIRAHTATAYKETIEHEEQSAADARAREIRAGREAARRTLAAARPFHRTKAAGYETETDEASSLINTKAKRHRDHKQADDEYQVLGPIPE